MTQKLNNIEKLPTIQPILNRTVDIKLNLPRKTMQTPLFLRKRTSKQSLTVDV